MDTKWREPAQVSHLDSTATQIIALCKLDGCKLAPLFHMTVECPAFPPSLFLR